MIEFNSSSGAHISALYFGGSFKEKTLVPDRDELGTHLKYKSGIKKGELRYKSLEVTKRIKGLGLKAPDKLKTKKEGVYQTNEAVLALLAKKEKSEAGKIAALMLKIRYLEKQIKTYYNGTEKFIHEFDSCVHHELCHFGYDKGEDRDGGGGVVTGRLSGQKPNMLNQPKSSDSNVREHFVPRNGLWISADFSQIEPCASAQISGDINFQNDIKNGIDFHCKYLALQEEMPYEEVFKLCKIDKIQEWEFKRSNIKSGFTFKRAYGAGVKNMALSTGLSVEDIKDLIKKEEREYPDLISFQNRNKKIVEAHGELQTVFGRILQFKKYPSPDWMREQGIFESYKPQEIINYPIQSVGSADLTLIMIGHFWRTKAIYNRDKYLMINTVYDSLDIDCKPEYEKECKEDLKCLTNVKKVINMYFTYDWIVEVKIDIKSGLNWYEVGL